jgi:hypothetical protein
VYIEREGLGEDLADLLAIGIVNGVLAANVHHRVVSVPRGWETAATASLPDGTIALAEPLRLVPFDGQHAGSRERSVACRRTERWPIAARRERQLLLNDDLPPATRRSYRVAHAADADGALRVDLFARVGTADERRIGTVQLTGDLAPAGWSPSAEVLLYPPLAVLDVTILGAAIVLAPIVVPLYLLKTGGPEPID